MRIAILTQPLRANYGGALQNFALQQILVKLGHTPVTIEKDPIQYISKARLFFDLPKRLVSKYILRRRKYILNEQKHNEFIATTSQTLRPFIDKYIKRQFVNNFKDIDYHDYDAFIVGSDQVWRPVYNWGIIDKMFLSFIPHNDHVKRIAYAASFGTSEWEYSEAQTNECKALIANFDAVSTREVDGVDLCKKYFNRNDAITVLDPTMLLEKSEYEALCNDIPIQKDKTLFAYILDVDNATKAFLEKAAAEKGLTLKLISADDNCTLSVEEWLAMFRDAECVITDSFHGTVYSIIFNQDFYSICNKSRGNARFLSLLSQFDLQERLFNDIAHIKFGQNDIAWLRINKMKELLQDKSIKFLIDNLIANG